MDTIRTQYIEPKGNLLRKILLKLIRKIKLWRFNKRVTNGIQYIYLQRYDGTIVNITMEPIKGEQNDH